MYRNVILILIAVLAFSATTASAQFGNIKKTITDRVKTEPQKTVDDSDKQETPTVAPSAGSDSKNLPNDPDYFYVGADDLEGTPIGGLRVCADTSGAKVNWKNEFKQWFTDISATAQLKMFERNRCELMGFEVINRPGLKYRKVDDLKERAEGLSVYQVEAGELVLIKDFVAPDLWVVVVPEVVKPGLKLTDLNICVKPDQKDYYRHRTKGAYNCHNTKQAVDLLEDYKKYPGEYQTNSALFFDEDFQKLNAQGKFAAFVIYRLVDGELIRQ